MTPRKTFLYQRLYDDVLAKIEQGVYAQGQLLPSERELGEMHSVDRTTVRRALQMLCEDGWVSKIPGKGTMVASGKTNATGPSLAESNAKTIGFFLPQSKDVSDKITFPTYTSLLYIVEKACAGRGMHLIYSALDENRELDSYLSIGYDGIIFLSATEDKHLQRAHELGIPSVLLNNHNPNVMSVATDNFDGGRAAARYFLDRGHHSFAVLAGNLDSRNCRERVEGFESMLHEAGVKLDDDAVLCGTSWSFDAGHQATRDYFSTCLENARPTAIFACGDRLALGAIKALQELSLRVPDDVSIIGYDNSEQAAYANPKLTSIDTNLDIMGRVAVRLLSECMQDRSIMEHPVKIMIPPSLVAHDSVCAR